MGRCIHLQTNAGAAPATVSVQGRANEPLCRDRHGKVPNPEVNRPQYASPETGPEHALARGGREQ